MQVKYYLHYLALLPGTKREQFNSGDCVTTSISESLCEFASCYASDGVDSDCHCPIDCFGEDYSRSNAAAIKTGMIF
jgi:hypothetical protein